MSSFRSGCSYRATAETWLRHQGRIDTEVVEMGTLEGILGCVEAGMGFAVAPDRAIRGFRGVDSLALTPLPEPFATAETHLAWRVDHRPSQAQRALVRLLEER